MKITQADYDALKQSLTSLVPQAKAHREYIIAEGKSKDIERRLRWDMLNASGYDVLRRLYAYLNDSHIDTALRAIMAELGV